jgi:hypothetical protein
MDFYQVFLLEISRQSCRGDCEYQGGKLLRLLSGFRYRIRPQKSYVVYRTCTLSSIRYSEVK